MASRGRQRRLPAHLHEEPGRGLAGYRGFHHRGPDRHLERPSRSSSAGHRPRNGRIGSGDQCQDPCSAHLPYASNEPLLAAVDTINRSLLRQSHAGNGARRGHESSALPDTRRYHQAVALLHQTVDRLIAHHRAHEGDDDAIMHGLAQAENAAENTAQRFTLRDQLITLFLAGHETTACALAWTFYYLSEQPAWAETLGSEADAVLNGGAPTVAALAQLTQTQRVIDESLRLRPPIYGIGRRARTEDDLGGWRIPAESPVVVSPYVMHHHPAYWDHPEQFDPDRFTPSFASGRPRFSYFPFEVGHAPVLGFIWQ